MIAPAFGYVYDPVSSIKVLADFTAFLSTLGINWIVINSVPPPAPEPMGIPFIVYWASFALFLNIAAQIVWFILVGIGHGRGASND